MNPPLLSATDRAILAVLKPRPLYEPVPGAPFQPGDGVLVTASEDAAGYPERVGQAGKVTYLEYDCGCGQRFPDDPMIGVTFDDGAVLEFWQGELAPGAAA